MAPTKHHRCIEPVPALLVMMLHDLGKLPEIPNLPRAGVLGFREPEMRDMEAVKWVAQWQGDRTDKDGFRKVAGLATFRDYYQMHTASDVREIVALRGSRRAVVDLTVWMRDDAEAQNRRLVGSFERDSIGLAQLMSRLGGRPIPRLYWEYHPQ
jgi:hypothetical protein